MKKLLGFSIILIALVLGSYFGMGVLTERAIKKNIDALNRANDLNVVLKSYHRGLFRSHAVLDWELNVAASGTANQPIVVHMPLVIGHGPIIFSQGKIRFGLGHATSTVTLPLNDPKVVAQSSTQPVLGLSVFVSYFNQTTIELIVPKFNLTSTDGHFSVNSTGIKVNIHISATHKQIDGMLLVDGVTWAKDQTQATLGQVKSDYSVHLTHKGLSLGSANVTAPYFSIAQRGQKVLEVRDISLHSKNDVSKGLFNSTLQANFGQLLLNQKRYTDGQIVVDIGHLDAATLTQINSKLSKMSQADEATQQAVLLSILTDLPALLNKGGELKLSTLSIVTPEGGVKANISVVFPNEPINNPFLLAQKVHGDGKVIISASVLKHYMLDVMMRQAKRQAQNQSASGSLPAVEPPLVDSLTNEYQQQAEQKINTLIQSGVLVLNGSEYILELELKNGALKVNGKSFNPSMLQL